MGYYYMDESYFYNLDTHPTPLPVLLRLFVLSYMADGHLTRGITCFPIYQDLIILTFIVPYVKYISKLVAPLLLDLLSVV